MYQIQWSLKRPVILVFMLAALLLVGCGAGLTNNSNWAGVSVSGDRVYVAYGSHVAAVDIVEQKEVWRYPEDSSQTPYLAPPEVDNGKVFIADYGENQGMFSPGVIASVYALSDVDSGVPATLWRASNVANDRIVAQPLSANGQVFVGTADNFLVALNAQQAGSELWRVALGHGVWGQPAFAEGMVLVASMDRSVYAINADNGDIVWQTTVDGALPSNPVIVDETVLVAGFDAQLHALDLNSGDELWKISAEDWIWNRPAVLDSVAYFSDVKGNVYAIDVKSGEQKWVKTIDGAVEGGLAAAGNAIYVPLVFGTSTDEQSGALLALSAENGNQLWQIDTPNPLFITPVVVDDMLVVPNQDDPTTVNLLVLDLVEGTQRWKYTVGAE